MTLKQARLLFVQYTGDYREAAGRLATGGRETYYAQKYSVDAVAEFGQKLEEAAVLCCLTEEPYNEVLPNGVRAIGAGFDQNIQVKKLIKLIEEQNPTHLVVRTPIRGIFRWAIQNKVQTFAALADSFPTQGLRNKIKNYLLACLLNHKQVKWVGNHGINSCKSLQELGIESNKVIPYDYTYNRNPELFSPKSLSKNAGTFDLVYVGSVTESKGVGDILESIAILKSRSFSLTLKIAGRGETDFFIDKAKRLKIEDCIEFLGLVTNDTVIDLMRASDGVLVPSRHEYPEGIPLTIYEALCSRTPLIASDHPMFENNLKHGINAIVFPAGNSQALAESIEKLFTDPDLYQSLSVASCEAWKRLQIPVKWADMIDRWLDDSSENQQWLFEHRFASGRYQICC